MMFKILRRRIIPTQNIQTCSCSGSNAKLKTVSKMPPELVKDTDIVTESHQKEISPTEGDEMKWRTPWHQKEGQYYSTLRTFYSEHNNVTVMKLLQMPINLTPSAIKAWWMRKQEAREIMLQQYIPERNQILGNELAAAHFIVYRGGSVKFFGQDFWIKMDQFNNYELPNRHQPNMHLQAIDCSEMQLYFEGLVNLRDLKQVEWLSINDCPHMDDWCMDRIANIFSRTLLYLDIRDCPNITHRGVGALARMEKLKILYVDNILYSNEFEMTCLMLQQILPHLDIRTE